MITLTYRYFSGFLAVFIVMSLGLFADQGYQNQENSLERSWDGPSNYRYKKNDSNVQYLDVEVESFYKQPEENNNNRSFQDSRSRSSQESYPPREYRQVQDPHFRPDQQFYPREEFRPFQGSNPPGEFRRVQRIRPAHEDSSLVHESNIDKKMQKRVYLLQIGDQLEIFLYGNVDIETKRVVRVEPSGYISYLFIEPVYALGKSIDQLRKDIAEAAKKIYPHIMVSINAVNLIGDQYTVMGEVRGPGTKQIHGEMRILDALGAAGGFPMHTYRGQLMDYADLDRAFLSRRGNYVPVDFNALIRQGDISQNIYIRSGDYLFIPSLINKQVFVLGEVAQPLAYSYLHTASVMEALTWAGGPTILASDVIVVIRGSLQCPKPFILDWPRLRTSCCPDFLLQPGDIVYVPRDRYWEASEIVKAGIRAFVGAVASIGGEATFIKLVPDASGLNSNSVFVNPGVNVSVPAALP